MPLERIDSIYDLQALGIEQEKYLNLLKESKAAIIDLNGQRVTVKSSSLSEFSKATDELDKAMKKTNITTELGIKENARLMQSVKAVNALVQQRFASEAKLATLQVQNGKATNDYNKQTIANRTETARLNKEVKNTVEAEQSAIGSRDRAMAQIKVLTAQKDKLNLVNKDEKKQYDEIVVKLQRYEAFLKSTGSAAEKQRANIGNYSGAVNVLKKSFDEVVAKMDLLTKEGKTQDVVFQQLTKEYELLNKLVNSQEAGFANATMEIRANQKALLDLENAGLAGTESFKNLEKATGDLQDQLSDLKTRTKALGSDTFVFDGLIDAAQGLAGAYGAAQGVAQLFGNENEDLQKSMAKLQAVMAIIQGLQAIQNALQAESAAMLLLQDVRTKALAISQSIYTVAVGASTGAMKIFRIALLATGIGAIIGILYLAAEAMGAFGDSAEDTTESLEDQAEAIKKNKESLKEIADESEKLRNRSKGGLNDLKRELELATARGSSKLKLQKIKDEIAAKELYNLKVQFYTFEGYADKQNDINEEGRDLANKTEAEKLSYQKRKLDEAEKLRKEAADKEKKRREKALEDAKKFAEDELNATFNILRDTAEERARQAENVSNDEERSLNDRLSALTDYYVEKTKIISAQRDFDLIGIKKGSQQEREILRRAGIENTKLFEEFASKETAIRKSNADKALADAKKSTDDKIKLVDDEAQAIRDKNQQEYSDAIISLNEQLDSRLLSQEEYNKARAKADAAYQVTSLITEIEYQKKLIAISSLPAEQKRQALAKLAELEMQLSDAIKDNHIKNEEEKLAATLKTIDGIRQASEAVFTFIDGLLNANATSQKNKLAEQTEEQEKKAAREIEIVNASVISEEEKAARITVINARLAAQKDDAARKEKRIEADRAKFAKAVAIFNIILNTAQAVVKFLSQGNIPGAIIAGVVGAAQLAVAIATPIPKYKHGRGTGKEEIAITGDGGVSEYIVRESGAIERTPAVETLTHLMPKDRVLPNKATLMKELAMGMLPVVGGASNQLDKGDINRLADRIDEAVSGIRVTTQLVTKEGWRTQNQRLSDYNSWVNKYVK